jgi:hypothetical protein
VSAINLLEIATTNNAEINKITEAAEASGQLRRSLTKLSMSIERVRLDAPPKSAGVTKNPSESKKVNVAAVAIPFRLNGSKTFRNVVVLEAPNPSLARSKFGSICTKAAYIGRTA